MPLTEIRIDTDRSIVVASQDDVEDILEHNKTLRSMEQPSDWGRHIASIPNVICLRWLNEEYQRGHEVKYLSKEWDELVARKLKDPEWAYLRVDQKGASIGWQK